MKQLFLISALVWTSILNAQVGTYQEVLDVFFYGESFPAISAFIQRNGKLDTDFENDEKTKYYKVTPEDGSVITMVIGYEALNRIHSIGLIYHGDMSAQIKRDYANLRFKIGGTVQDNLYNFKSKLLYQFKEFDYSDLEFVQTLDGEEMMRTLENSGMKISPLSVQ